MSKVKKIFKAISLVLATALITLVPVGCKGNGGNESSSSDGNPKLPATALLFKNIIAGK